ncbi:hypothetical protein [Sphingomonas sp. OTU376]|uniref:hypothetical protein n=1 Tax=Sphingomonas sp. OTU376 TaxID=3043863 RepID=UPI00313E7701
MNMSSEDSLLVDRGQKLPEARVGWALIAIGKGTPKRITDYRLSISEKLLARYSFVEVDTSDKIFEEKMKLPTWTPGLHYIAELTVEYRVEDPVVAAQRGTRLIWPRIRSTVLAKLSEASQLAPERPAAAPDAKPPARRKGRAVAVNNSEKAAPASESHATLQLGDLSNAQQKVNAACAHLLSTDPLLDRGITLLALSATLSLEGEAAKHAGTIGMTGLRIAAQDAEHAVEEELRKKKEVLLSKGVRGIFAEALRTTPNMLSNLLEQLSSLERERYGNELSIMRELFAQGHLEGHHLPPDVRDEFLKSVLNKASLGEILMLGEAAKGTVASIEDKSAS